MSLRAGLHTKKKRPHQKNKLTKLISFIFRTPSSTSSHDLPLVYNRTFNSATKFARDLNGWKTGSATKLYKMFAGAVSFNGNVQSWQTSIVTSLSNVFSGSTAFQGNGLAHWDTSRVTTFNKELFFEAGITTCNKRKLADVWSTESKSIDSRLCMAWQTEIEMIPD